MKPRFEEHEDQLFRILDKPVPLTPDAEMPCLVRLIQDDSPMGKYNQDMCKLPLRTIEMCIGINRQYQSAISKSSSHYARYEVIGCHVAEGSKEWALYQMMQGEKVRHESYVLPKVHCAMNERGDVICYANDLLTSRQADAMINERTGWQIYKEPKPEPAKEPIADCDNCKHRCPKRYIDHCHMYEPKPTFKVGDWVEYRLDGDTYYGKICNIRGYVYYLSVTTEEIPKDQARAIMLEGIIRKLFPREVIVHIGCLSGTVRPVSTNGIHMWFHLIGVDDKTIATIRIGCLDKETRKLVEGLLKAQEEETK